MENLPVELIGNILSHVGSARDVVVASLTCKKWREAMRNHLNYLSFDHSDRPYRDLSCSSKEILITSTIFQTRGLQRLTISMDILHGFSVASATAWLMYTRDSLCDLHYNVRTYPNFNIIDLCGRRKLQVLFLGCNSISGVDPSYHKFPCLKSLSLCFVRISALDLSLLLSACPILETLSLVIPNISISDLQAFVELRSSSLKYLYVKCFGTGKLIIEADLLEYLQLENCTFETFQLIEKGTLKVLKFDHVNIVHLDIGDNIKNLEILDVCNFKIRWPKLYNMISKAPKLYKLQLWGVVFNDEVVNIETISDTFPRPRHLCLSYDFKDVVLHYGLHGLPFLMNVTVLELLKDRTSTIDLFSDWVAGLLKECPNLKKLVLYGLVSQINTSQERQILSRFSEFIRRKCRHRQFKFDYE